MEYIWSWERGERSKRPQRLKPSLCHTHTVIEIALNGGSEKEKREENTEARRAFVEVETVLDGDRGGVITDLSPVRVLTASRSG